MLPTQTIPQKEHFSPWRRRSSSHILRTPEQPKYSSFEASQRIYGQLVTSTIHDQRLLYDFIVRPCCIACISAGGRKSTSSQPRAERNGPERFGFASPAPADARPRSIIAISVGDWRISVIAAVEQLLDQAPHVPVRHFLHHIL